MNIQVESNSFMESRRPSAPADIITYRLNNKMVYVTPANNYEEALDFAQREFPDELQKVSRDKISFFITVITGGNERRTVRIAQMAWSTVVATLRRFEIIDVLVQPELNIIPDVPPPQYLAADSKEATEFFRARSCPPSSPPSARQLSPARSLGSDHRNTKGWFERHFS